jgi:hypothetical protein
MALQHRPLIEIKKLLHHHSHFPPHSQSPLFAGTGNSPAASKSSPSFDYYALTLDLLGSVGIHSLAGINSHVFS